MLFRSRVWAWRIRPWPAADSPAEEEAPTLTRIWMQSHKIYCRSSSSSTIHYCILFFWFGCCGFGNQESGCFNLISPNSSYQKNPLLSSNPLLDSEHTAQPLKNLTKKECRYFQKLKRDSDSTHTINPKVHYWTPNSKETKIIQESASQLLGPSKVQTWGRAKHKGVQRRRRRRRRWRKRLNLLTF
jgi:hypothetical protein